MGVKDCCCCFSKKHSYTAVYAKKGSLLDRSVGVIGRHAKTSLGISITAFVLLLLVAMSGGAGVVGHLTGLQYVSGVLSLKTFSAMTAIGGGGALFLLIGGCLVPLLLKRASSKKEVVKSVPVKREEKKTSPSIGLVAKERIEPISLIKSKVIRLKKLPKQAKWKRETQNIPRYCYAIFQFTECGKGKPFLLFYRGKGAEIEKNYYDTLAEAIGKVQKTYKNYDQWTKGMDKKELIKSKIITIDSMSDSRFEQPPIDEYAIYKVTINLMGKEEFLLYYNSSRQSGWARFSSADLAAEAALETYYDLAQMVKKQ